MEAVRKAESTGTRGTTHFGRFRLLEAIGQGGMANVRVAVIPGPARFNKLVVLKTICEHIQSDDSQYARMFLDEARLAGQLNHQNVVHTYEVGDENGVYYIAMEYLEGQPLNKVQSVLGPNGLPLEARLRILIDTAHGLHHAHELADYSGRPLHVVHRDVSPQNIFLTYDGQIKLLDFGIAKMRDAQTVTVVGEVKGKIDYMAPEQLQGGEIDRTADVFALGAIMWELLAGKPMSGGRAISQIARMHNRLAKKERSLREAMPELDRELSRICDKALMHEPRDRYPTALEFAHDLQRYLTERALSPTSQQLAQVLEPAFGQERAERRKRIEAALEAVEREQTLLTDSEIHDSGARLTLAGQLRHTSGASVSVQLAHSGEAEPGTSEIIAARSPRGPGRLQSVAIIAAVACAAAWLQLRSEPQAATKTSMSATESTTQAASPGGRDDLSKPASTPLTGSETQTGSLGHGDTPEDKPMSPPKTVKLSVSSLTPGVQVRLDGSAIAQLPLEAEVVRDGRIHRLVASAPGYKTSAQVLTLDRDREITFELSKDDSPTSHQRSRTDKSVGVAKRPAATGVAPSTLTADPTSPETAEPLPGQEMVRRGRGAPAMSEEDPWR